MDETSLLQMVVKNYQQTFSKLDIVHNGLYFDTV